MATIRDGYKFNNLYGLLVNQISLKSHLNEKRILTNFIFNYVSVYVLPKKYKSNNISVHNILFASIFKTTATYIKLNIDIRLYVAEHRDVCAMAYRGVFTNDRVSTLYVQTFIQVH